MRRTISGSMASKVYGIESFHEQMPSGEIRFRLRNRDGSGYVRTVAGKPAWQGAHYHVALAETYVVDKGWMALAYLRGRRAIIKRFGPGSVITVSSNVPHGVYLPAEAVIHTVKQGRSVVGDWYASPDLSRILEARPGSRILRYPIKERRRELVKAKDRIPPKGHAEYSESYRHFDSLIWQLPAWSTAVFAALLSALAFLSSSASGSIEVVKGLGAPALSMCLLVGGLVFFSAGYFGLFRWRVHQRYTKRENAQLPRPRWLGGQMLLQLATGAEAAMVFALTLMTAVGAYHWGYVVLSGAVLLGVIAAAEAVLRRHLNIAERIPETSERTPAAQRTRRKAR